jgi:hypothetical protein
MKTLRYFRYYPFGLLAFLGPCTPNGNDPNILPFCESCQYAKDGKCDDGRAGSYTSLCETGTDCEDCDKVKATPATNSGGTTSPPPTTGGSTLNGSVDISNTLFVSGSNILLGNRKSKSEKFTISTRQTFDFRFASQYNAVAGIFDSNNIQNFLDFKAGSGFVIFENINGFKSVTLNPGTYYIGIRNSSGSDMIVAYELDRKPILKNGANYIDRYFGEVKSLKPNVKMWHEFKIQSAIIYVVEGLNSGSIDTFIIPKAELDNFKNSRPFKYYSDYAESTGGAPGGYLIELPPGDYALIARNKTSNKTSTIVYSCDRYRK